VSIQHIDRKRMNELKQELPAHWAPILDAMEYGVAVLMLKPQKRAWGMIPDAPLITVVGDDPADADSQGPEGFDTGSIFNHFQRAAACVVIAGEARIEHYAVAASVPLMLGLNCIVVETQPAHMDAWTQLALSAGIGRLLVITHVLPPDAMSFARPVGETLH
jgi:hypothetical protein